MHRNIMLRKPESFVSPEYQGRLDRLAENLCRFTGEMAVQEQLDFEQAAEDFDRVFSPPLEWVPPMFVPDQEQRHFEETI